MDFKLRFWLMLGCIFAHFISTGQAITRVFQTGHAKPVNKMVFSLDGNYLASIAGDQTIIIWEVASGKQYAELKGHAQAVGHIDFHPSQPNVLISAGLDGQVISWDYKKAEIIDKINVNQTITDFCFGRLVDEIYLAGDGLTLLNLKSHQIKKFSIPGQIKAVEKNEQGKLLYIGLENDLYYFDPAIGKVTDSLAANASQLVYTAQTQRFYSLEKGAVVREIFTAKNKGVLVSEIYKEQGKRYDFNAIVAGEVQIYCAGGEQNIFTYMNGSFKSTYTYGHDGYISALAIHEASGIVASAAADRSIIIWDKNTMKKIRTLRANFDQLTGVKFSSNHEVLFLSSANASLRYWELKSNTFINVQLPLDESRKRSGWRNSIIGIDSIYGEKVFFNYIEYRTQSNSDNLIQVKFFAGEWDVMKDEITFKQLNEMRSRLDDLDRDSYTLDKLIANNKREMSDAFKAIKSLQFDSLIVDMDHNEHYGFYACVNANGTINFVGEDGGLLLQVGLFNDQDFLFSDLENNYFGTKAASEYMNLRYDENLYNVGVLDALYNRPDIILAKLPYFNPDELDIVKQAVVSRQKKLKINPYDSPTELLKKLPVSKTTIQFDNKSGICELQINYTSKDVEVQHIQIKINGIPVSDKTVISTNGVLTEKISLIDKENYIEVITFASNGLQSLPETFNITHSNLQKSKQNLYLIGIGVSNYKDSLFNLSYADKDVSDLLTILKKSKEFEQVKTLLLLNESATLDNVTSSTASFLKEVKSDDVVIIFYAGHGVLDAQYDYYLATNDMNFLQPNQKGLAYEKLLTLIDASDCRNKLLIIDACHSGEIDKNELADVQTIESSMDENITFRAVGSNVTLANSTRSAFELSKMLFSDLRPSNGTIVISSAGGLEFAMESAKLKNGVFTFALIEGITSNSADLNQDGKIQIKELESYLPIRVLQLTKGMQRANSRSENSHLNFVFY